MTANDPDSLDDVDREIRINELKEKVKEVAGQDMTCYESQHAPPEILEQFWQNVLNVEQEGWTSARKQLQRDGVALPALAELSDAELTAKLDEIFARLATHHTVFVHTNHLSDRELYECLLTELLDEEFPDMLAVSPTGAYIIDLVGSGSEEDSQIYLRYYADEEYRRQYHEDYPEDVIPPKEQAPFDRDRRLPQPPEGW
jgi:hypothetical protein